MIFKAFRAKGNTGKFLQKLQNQFDEINKKYVAVGVVEGKRYQDGTPVALIASVHEFGTDKIPERSFIRSSINENKGRIKKLIDDKFKLVTTLKATVDNALKAIGFFVASSHKNKILEGKFTPLSEEYVKRKEAIVGHKKGILRLTDTLLKAIDFEIRK